jgi:hypothetical protein
MSATGLGAIIGVDVAFDDAMGVRRGALTGSMHNGQMTLHWGASLKPIGYRILMTLALSSKRLGSGTAALHDPFDRPAELVEPGEAVNAAQTHSTDKGVAQSVGSYWVAHRVG